VSLVGCAVFRTEFEHLMGPDAAVRWLPAGLHVSDERLEEALSAALRGSSGAACLYGACFPDMDALLEAHDAHRLPVRNCGEAFLSPEARAAFGDRAYIMSPGYLREWRTIYVDGMGWDEIDGRINFGMYDVIVLLDFGLEPIDDIDVLEFFDFTQTEITIVQASLDWFKERIAELLALSPQPRDTSSSPAARGR
jgi:Protein of unknown function (DUF1638)